MKSTMALPSQWMRIRFRVGCASPQHFSSCYRLRHNREKRFGRRRCDITSLKTIFVIRSAEDDRGVYITIAEQLRKTGLLRIDRTRNAGAANTDAVLSYQAKWQWDLTMYLLELRVTLRNPTTDTLLGAATSYHTSATRKSTTRWCLRCCRIFVAASLPLSLPAADRHRPSADQDLCRALD